ncbi:MAG TPA: RNA pseudouridine synthase [Usitatibacteraceae bacterium]
MTEPLRLAKRLAEMIPCSRREAELYIEGGWVMVDGQVVEEPQFRVSTERIELHAAATLSPLEPATMLYHQPADDAAEPPLSAATRWAEDASGIHLLKRHFVGLKPTLPIEAGASGLRVVTQNWRITRKLVDDAATVEQEYIVAFPGQVSDAEIGKLKRILDFQGRALPPAKVSRQNETHLRFAIKGARLGQITFLCAQAGLKAESMKRIRIGRVAMAKLPLAQWRYLAANERF